MSRRNPRAKWVLPTVVNPPKRICFQIEVPDEKYHVAAFLGALYNLTSAVFWADDTAHTAKSVASVWQEIYDNISRQCVAKFIDTYVSMVDDMPFFREVCENDKCYLEFQCCPGEWIRLGNADQVPAGGQPGGGSPQPAPGGGTADYCAQLQANNKLLIPTVVNSGDTISITAGGAGNGGASDPYPLQWYCPDGSEFFAGACLGTTFLSGGDPLPATPHLQLIVNVGGTFYPFTAGSFTVPGGVSNAPAYIQVNDANIADNSGSYQVCVTVKNNQATTWTHTLHFDLNDGMFNACLAGGSTPASNYVTGHGWEQVNGILGGTNADNRIFRPLVGTTITSVVVSGLAKTGTTIDVADGDNGTLILLASQVSSGTTFSLSWSGSVTLTHGLRIDAYLNFDITATSTIVTVIVTGTGTDPF